MFYTENYKLIIPKLLVYFYFILKPFYLFSPGSPQIAEVILIFLFIYLALNGEIYKTKRHKSFVFLLLFFVLIIVINGYYFIIYFDGDNSGFLSSILYYGFNIVSFTAFVSVFKRFVVKDYLWLLKIITATLVIQLVLFFIGFDKFLPTNNFYGRRYLYFNNPNQLGYFCILASTIMIATAQYIKEKRYLITIGLSIALVLCFFSSTRPAILGVGFLSIYYFISVFKRANLKYALLYIFPIVIVMFFNISNVKKEFNRNYSRIERVELETAKEFSNRGLERLASNTQYLLWGAGEGNYCRFVNTHNIYKQEIHNSILNIAFCYGIAGLILFYLFLHYSFNNLSLKYLLLLLPLMFYNMFHNGIRLSLLWFVFALFFVLNEKCIINRIVN